MNYMNLKYRETYTHFLKGDGVESMMELKMGAGGMPKSGRRPTCSQRSPNSEDTAWLWNVHWLFWLKNMYYPGVLGYCSYMLCEQNFVILILPSKMLPPPVTTFRYGCPPLNADLNCMSSIAWSFMGSWVIADKFWELELNLEREN